MTALAELSRADRRRLLEHLAEANELDQLMRQPGGLASVPEPTPLHRHRMTKFSATSSSKAATTEGTRQ